jgi:hypothetical protein
VSKSIYKTADSYIMEEKDVCTILSTEDIGFGVKIQLCYSSVFGFSASGMEFQHKPLTTRPRHVFYTW